MLKIDVSNHGPHSITWIIKLAHAQGDILCSDSFTILAKQHSLSGLAFSFLICKEKGCINILRSLWLWQFMIQWFALKCLKKDGILAPELWVEFFFKIPFLFLLQCALPTCHWMSYNRSTKESSTFPHHSTFK